MTGKVTPKRLPSPRTFLGWDGTDFFAARMDSDGHLQIDVLSIVQDPLATTYLRQGHILVAIQNLYPLVAALQSVHTDRLKVRGEDQLLSYKGRLANHRRGTISGAGGFYDSNSPPAGEIWVVTNAVGYDRTTATTVHTYYTPEGVDLIALHRQTEAFGAGILSEYHGLFYLEEGDVVSVYFTGALAGDDCVVQLSGSIMTVEA